MWISDREIDTNPDEKAAYNYLNSRLAAEGAAENEIDGVRWYAVVRQGTRMPDLVRMVWENGKIISVKTLDIITREPGGSTNGAVSRALDKFGQTGKSRQADNVLYWLNKTDNPRQTANDIAEALVAKGANGDSARFASSGVGDDFDLTKPLGANSGAIGNTGSDAGGSGPDVEIPPAVSSKVPPGMDGYGEPAGEVEMSETGWVDPIDIP